MPKAEKGTPKDIAKRIKSKGLQKLKFYCQLCEKQCRDANGFKCHISSESHLRQMKIFSENAGGMMDKFSKEFEKEYLTTLKQRHTTKRVNANNVYQEVIADKQHIHMNATRWAALSDFVMYLGKTGKCVVDETERGWYVQFIENDASILAQKEAQERRAAAEKVAELAQAERMEQQRVEAAKALDRAGGSVRLEATNLEKDDNNQVIQVALKKTAGATNKKKTKTTSAASAGFFNDDDDDDDEAPNGSASIPPPPQPTTKIPAKQSMDKRPLEKTKEDPKSSSSSKRLKYNDDSRSEEKKDSNIKNNAEEPPWLKRDILVRIINKKLANGKYFKRKAIVDHVLKDDKYVAEVEVLDSGPDTKDGGDVLRLDQKDLETVVPKEGKTARILKGPHRGKKATVLSVDKKKYRATLKLLSEEGTILEKVDFEDFSKLA